MTTKATRFSSTPTVRAMAACFQARVPVAIEAAPGQAKSATGEALARSWDWHYTCITGSNRDQSDYLGLPTEKIAEDGTKETDYLALSWVRRLNEHTEGALLQLDEFRNVSDEVMRAMHRVLEEGYVGETKLADHVCIMLSMNPVEQSTAGIELPPAIINRICLLPWQPDLDAWMHGMIYGFDTTAYPSLSELAPFDESWSKQIFAMVVGFCRSHEQYINAMPGDARRKSEIKGVTDNLDDASKPWASMRSWHKLASVLSYVHPDDVATRKMVVEGLIGPGVGSVFLDWYKSQDMIDPLTAINDPSTIKWTTLTPDRIFVLASSIAAFVAHRDDANLWSKAASATVSGIKAGRIDNATIMANQLIDHMVPGASIPSDFRDAFSALFTSTGRLKAASK